MITEETIPKIIHYCWFGQNEKNAEVINCLRSWERFFPDWTIVEWNEKTFPLELACDYVKEAADAGAWAFVSDYVRLWALESQGGIYFDTDVEVIRPFNEILDYRFFVCAESLVSICTAVIGSNKHNKIIAALLQTYSDDHFLLSDGSYNREPNTKRFQSFFENVYGYDNEHLPFMVGERSVILSNDYFSPINCYTGLVQRTENTLAIHHFGNSWKSSKEKIIRKAAQVVTRIIGEKRRREIVNRLHHSTR